MSGKWVLGGLIALAMMVGGGYLAFAGMGYLGGATGTSREWAFVGSLLAGLGVALAITVFRPKT